MSLHSIFHLPSAPFWREFLNNSDDIWSDDIFFTSNANGCRILVGKHLLILQKNENSNLISWKLWYHYIMHGGHYSYCKEKLKEKWAWTKESCLWVLCGNMNDLEHFSLLEFQKSYWNKKQDISNMQINEFQYADLWISICRLMNFNARSGG